MNERQPGLTSPKAQSIASEVHRRIVEREWAPGERIPDEADLAIEFNAARATVNKALQLLADKGLLERKRRAGTRVAVNPVRKATFTIPIVRKQIESAGMTYSHRLIAKRHSPVPEDIATRIGLKPGSILIHLREVHYGDGRAFQFEDRWMNPAAMPGLENIDFRVMNANEWLVRNAPYLHAEMTFSADNANARDARMLQVPQGTALLILHRTTWNDAGPITTARIACQPGYVMSTAS